MTFRTLCLLGTALLATPPAVAAQPAAVVRSEVIRRTPGDTINDSYRVYRPAGRATALLVLLPGYGGDVDSYAPESGYTPSTLPQRLAAHGIATVVAVPASETLYADASSLRRLDALVADARARYATPGAPVAVGGFSAGGTGAVRFAQRCAAKACGGNPPVAGVFAVDAPLDLRRMWQGAALSVARRSPRANLDEARTILADLRRALGGAPHQAPAAYRRASPLLATAVDGGNARWLHKTPVRLYTEPDVHWWIEQRSLDYLGMNAADLAALVNVLRIGGNTRAELITTRGRGVRPNGARHPHSWSIVDEDELAGWLVGLLVPGS
jgi:thioesterase domain-containing protein